MGFGKWEPGRARGKRGEEERGEGMGTGTSGSGMFADGGFRSGGDVRGRGHMSYRKGRGKKALVRCFLGDFRGLGREVSYACMAIGLEVWWRGIGVALE